MRAVARLLFVALAVVALAAGGTGVWTQWGSFEPRHVGFFTLFAAPLVLALAVIIGGAGVRHNRRVAALFRGDLLERVLPARVRTRRWARDFLGLFGVACLVVALAEPLYGKEVREVEKIPGGISAERELREHHQIGPQGHGVRRQDILAMLRWTLPKLRRILGQLPERLTVVSAGDPMWRGGLSAPRSLFLHAERTRSCNE